jgi:hypothetical protein
MRVWKVENIGQGDKNIEKNLNRIERTPGVTLYQIIVTDYGVNLVTFTEKDVSSEDTKAGKAGRGTQGNTEGAGGVCQAGVVPDRGTRTDNDPGAALLN